ncbi:hypothetical protein N9Y42_08070 [Mariniblastus sp.]|nr:hypothetical protein [Mariniblastus sp.]
MEPVSSLTTGHITGKLIDYVSAAFRVNVIERWSKRRAAHFFQQFCDEVEVELAGGQSEHLETLLDQMLEDEHATELLFDAYRRVSLSRSKTIGPRLIGVLTAQLALEQRYPSGREEAILFAAEELDDDELLAFSSFVRETRDQLANESNDDVTVDRTIVSIKWMTESFESTWSMPSDISISPLNLYDSHGSWAVKMSMKDIMRTDITERTEYLEIGEGRTSIRHVTWWVKTWDTYFRFADIIDRVASRA